MSKYSRQVILLLAFLLAATSALAQSSGARLSGRVTDESGAALPGVTVTATNDATGFNRSTVTGGDGGYLFPSLPVGTYTVVADLSGFAPVTVKNVVLNVASERTFNVTLRQAAVRENITVTAEAPLIATEPAVGTVVSQRELENLPLNGRQFANLGSLAPGTSLAVNTDPTKPGQLTIALNGGIGRNVNYTVDGGDNMDDTIGGALQNFNLEAVQEFKIQTMQYKAEFGRSSGGVLTVVTKTGTNDFGGSVYGFFRDKSLNEKTKVEEDLNRNKAPYERKQYGGSLGGPIVRDRAHFFGTYENLDRKTQYLVDTRGIFPDFDGDLVPTPFTDELITGKATLNATAAQFLQVRYGYQKNSAIYGATARTLPSALGTTTNKYRSILAGHTWQLGGSRLNEFVYQWTKFNNEIAPNSNDPFLFFPNGTTVGENRNTPQRTRQEKSQFKDDFSWSVAGRSRHDFKAGVNYVHEPILGGDHSVGTAGQYRMASDNVNAPVTEILINGGFAGFSTPVDQYSVYFQDDWGIGTQLTLNLGIRYDLWHGFDINQDANPLWRMLKSQTTYNEDYLRDFQGADDTLSNDTNNWGPRLGFSYDLTGDSKRVIRGGVGRFYDFPYTNATILFPTDAVQSVFGTVFQHTNPDGIRNADGSLFRPGQPLPPNQLNPNATRPLPADVASPTITNVPYSDQLSLSYSWELTPSFGVNIDASKVWYRDIPFRFRANPSLDANGQPIRNASGALVRRFASLGAANNFRVWSGEGEAEYQGINFGVRGRVTNKLELQGFYTLSESEGNILCGADEFRLNCPTFQPDYRSLAADVSINPLDPWCDACYGPLYTDARHRVTMSAVYRAPFDINVSGVARWRSALPYTKVNSAGTGGAPRDLNGDIFVQDLAPDAPHVNSERGDSFSQVDLRVSKEFRFGGSLGVELIGEIFNILNSDNPAAFNRDGTPTAYAGTDPAQGEQRLAQLGLRVRF